MKIFIISMLLTLVSINLQAQNKQTSTDHSIESEGQTKMIIGTKKPNAYSIISMQKAFDYYNSVVINSPFRGKLVKPTHSYIEIMPESEADLVILDKFDAEETLILHDYPLDNEIIQDGDYYVDPVDENDLYHPVYTVIPRGYPMPANLTYRTISQVYQPKDEEYDVETVALIFSGDKDEELGCLIGTPCNIKSKLKEVLNAPIEERQKLFGRRYRPHGYVKVKNTDNGQYEPLKRAKISIGRGIWWRYTHTDNNGHFTSPKKYRGKVRIRAKWRSNIATIRKSWNELLGLWVSDHLMTLKRSNNGRTKYIDQPNEHLWYKATVHNGLVRYNDYAQANGVADLIDHANVWVWKNGNPSGATPMLYRYRHLAQIASIANIGSSNLWDVFGERGLRICY